MTLTAHFRTVSHQPSTKVKIDGATVTEGVVPRPVCWLNNNINESLWFRFSSLYLKKKTFVYKSQCQMISLQFIWQLLMPKSSYSWIVFFSNNVKGSVSYSHYSIFGFFNCTLRTRQLYVGEYNARFNSTCPSVSDLLLDFDYLLNYIMLQKNIPYIYIQKKAWLFLI